MMGGVLGAALAVFVWVALLSRLLGAYQYQGRYLFPALIPFVFFFIGGLDRLLTMQRNKGTVVLVAFLMIVLDTWSLLVYILPYFYT